MLSAAIGYALTGLAAAYAWIALACRARLHRRADAVLPRTPVTVFKPLCGAEPRLEANLATLCRQTLPVYQLVFGVRDPDDPAIAVVHRLMRAHPQCNITLVIDQQTHGVNHKVGNLMNMARAARHPWLVIADSDIAVENDYLERVTAPLADAATGVVTCLYRGRAVDGFWSRLGAQFIDTWFLPSVRVASAFGSSAFGFGATLALRADTLQAIGGFAALKNRLADDYRLAELARAQGLATVLSEVCVTTDVTETSLAALFARERRWMQTIRSLNPLGYAFSFVTFTFPVAAIGLLLMPTRINVFIAATAMAARLGLHLRRPAPELPAPGNARYAPLRDALMFITWASAFAGATARWRERTVAIADPLEPGMSDKCANAIPAQAAQPLARKGG